MKTPTQKSRKTYNPYPWMGAAVLVSFLFLRSADNASATIYTISVPGTAPWTDTGIVVPSGSELQVSASGTITYGFSAGQQSGPNGGDQGTQFESLDVLPNAVVVSLIGKIGGTTAIGTGTVVPEGTPGDGAGFVGASYNETISTGGELFLGFNDHVGAFNDNSGSFSATITVTPVPEPSIGAFGGLACATVLAKRMRRRRSV